MRSLTAIPILTVGVLCLGFLGAFLTIPALILMAIINGLAQAEVVTFWPMLIYWTLSFIVLSLAPRRLP